MHPATTYTVYAAATCSDGREVRSPETQFTTSAAKTSHSGWLELPAKQASATAAEYVLQAGERNYTMFYDPSYYAALWVAYPLAQGHTGSLSRPSGWSRNEAIATKDQINLWDGGYGVKVSGTEYARGHQIPNGDRNGNATMQRQTFLATNSTPQIQDKFNGGIWAQLEEAVRAAVPSKDTLYIATGPVYRTVGGSETIRTISPQHDSGKRCPVPNYYYKVVLKVKRNSAQQVTDAMAVGFWFEHEQYSDSYDRYAVSVDEIERKTGFDFFANLPDDLEAEAEANGSWTTFRNF